MGENSWWYETSYLTNELELVTLRWTWWELLYPTKPILSTEAKMEEKIKKIEEKWGKEFELDWDIHKQRAEQIRNEYLDLATIKALCRIYYFQGCHERQKENLILPSECERLESRIKELLAKHDWDETIIKELEEGLRNAYEVIDYSGGGDAWEREATGKERDKFYEIYDKLLI